ncbi:hypothetical protein CLV88_11625 [Shimia abyssi]|uniref:Uncharacterized protein n=1 Tax=Shimia abyssi TaxID=1662395 RepID=A0A2P8F783_9RHOB|nr:hypothetical protein CLV88_11625 [Shimia abyssi]
MPAKLTTEAFIERARQIHGDRYDYRQTRYLGATKSVEITCMEHGSFSQRASRHLSGRGCPLCGEAMKGHNFRVAEEEFLTRASKTHGNRYDYSKVEYRSLSVPVKIICPLHGEFLQTPLCHMEGGGCDICTSEAVHSQCIISAA